jgi:hypothetical protein
LSEKNGRVVAEKLGEMLKISNRLTVSALYRTYRMNGTSVGLTVCGSTQQSPGCDGSGTLGPFVRLGALIEGNQTIKPATNTVTRCIYALEIAAGTNSDEVVSYVYRKTDTITPASDAVTVT